MSLAVLAAAVVLALPVAEPTRDELEVRFPTAEANDSARTLEGLAAAIGIDLVPKAVDDDARVHPEPGSHQTRQLRRNAQGYLKTELGRTRPELDAPDDKTAEFVSLTAPGITAIVAHLKDAAAPMWERDIDLGPLPNLLGIVDLQRHLLIHAIASETNGETERAIDQLDASIRLNHALADRPELISQLIRLAYARRQLALIRKLALPPAWAARADVAVIQATIHEAVRYETFWLNAAVAREARPEAFDPILIDDGLYGWYQDRRADLRQLVVGSLPVRAYVDSCVADLNARTFAAQQGYAQLDACALSQTTAFADLLEATPWWNRLGPVYAYNFDNVAIRLGRAMVEEELTRLILEMRAHRDRTGDWPETVERASLCREHSWTYERAGDGSIELALDPPLPPKTAGVLAYEVAFQASP